MRRTSLYYPSLLSPGSGKSINEDDIFLNGSCEICSLPIDNINDKLFFFFSLFIFIINLYF